MAAINRDPLTAPHRTRNDAIFAAGVAVLAVALALLVDDGRRLDPLGWALLLGAHVPLVWRRTRPVLVMLAVVACVAPYHGLDFHHAAPTPPRTSPSTPSPSPAARCAPSWWAWASWVSR